MSIRVIEGDLKSASEDIIGQQCNARGVMGSGVAKLIREQYPKAYNEYIKFCGDETFPHDLMGKCQIVKTETKFIANLFGQLNYGRQKVRYTDYNALRVALVKLKCFAEEQSLSVALPYNIGCGLANGEWSVVEKIIDEAFHDYEVTLYRL